MMPKAVARPRRRLITPEAVGPMKRMPQRGGHLLHLRRQAPPLVAEFAEAPALHDDPPHPLRPQSSISRDGGAG